MSSTPESCVTNPFNTPKSIRNTSHIMYDQPLSNHYTPVIGPYAPHPYDIDPQTRQLPLFFLQARLHYPYYRRKSSGLAHGFEPSWGHYLPVPHHPRPGPDYSGRHVMPSHMKKALCDGPKARQHWRAAIWEKDPPGGRLGTSPPRNVTVGKSNEEIFRERLMRNGIRIGVSNQNEEFGANGTAEVVFSRTKEVKGDSGSITPADEVNTGRHNAFGCNARPENFH